MAACSNHYADTGTNELAVFCVLTTEAPDGQRRIIRNISAQLAKEVGLWPRQVVPVPGEAFPKSSAGKIERRRLLADYQTGAFNEEPYWPRPTATNRRRSRGLFEISCFSAGSVRRGPVPPATTAAA